jgi:ABC-type antimicrobial peptide transport system permease subunit
MLQVAFWITGILGALALTLTMTGLFSVLSYVVEQQAKEIGVRMALGASPGAILRLVFTANVPTVVAGAIAGVAISLLAAERLRPLLFDLEPTDPATVAAAAGAVVVVTIAAAMLPARRAARMNPAAIVK